MSKKSPFQALRNKLKFKSKKFEVIRPEIFKKNVLETVKDIFL